MRRLDSKLSSGTAVASYRTPKSGHGLVAEVYVECASLLALWLKRACSRVYGLRCLHSKLPNGTAVASYRTPESGDGLVAEVYENCYGDRKRVRIRDVEIREK